MSDSRDSILIIDDDEQVSDVLSLVLESEGYEVESASHAEAALKGMAARPFSLVLLDLRLGEANGLDLFPHLRELDPNVPIFIITAHGDVDSAVEAFRIGATGYIKKPFQEGDLKVQIAQAIEACKLSSEVYLLHKQAKYVKSEDPGMLIRTRDPVMKKLLKKIEIAAQVMSNVVVTGESGVGKELVARALHLCGPRKAGPFVALNCAALPETLLESELFGYVRGAFTDARDNKPGLFARANGGTIFLDEIGDAPASIQTKLLRVLQEREFVPLGGTQAQKVDVRIVAATHKSLQEEVASGRFRQDLYYRLHVLPLHVPPLRERPRDILFLGALLATRMAEEMRLSFEGFTTNAEKALETHEWPGNVRELQNRIEHALAIGGGGRLSTRILFPERPDEPEFECEGDLSSAITPTFELITGTGSEESLPTYGEAKQLFERSYLVQLLGLAKGNIAKAARLASKSRTEVYSLLRKHRLDPGTFKCAGSDGGDAG